MTSARELYLAVVDDVFAAHGEGRLAEGLARLDSVPAELAPWRAELAYHRACLLGACGEPDAALAALQAASAGGDWWDPAVLRGDDDLLDDVRAVARALAGAGFQLDVIEGLGHEVPDAHVRRALEGLVG